MTLVNVKLKYVYSVHGQVDLCVTFRKNDSLERIYVFEHFVYLRKMSLKKGNLITGILIIKHFS